MLSVVYAFRMKSWGGAKIGQIAKCEAEVELEIRTKDGCSESANQVGDERATLAQSADPKNCFKHPLGRLERAGEV